MVATSEKMFGRTKLEIRLKISLRTGFRSKMDPAFSTFLSGALGDKSDGALTTLSQSPLFDRQLLGIVRELSARWRWRERTKISVPSEYECTPIAVDGILYVGFSFVGDVVMYCVDPQTHRSWGLTFDLTQGGKFRRRNNVVQHAYHPLHQQWVVETDARALEVFDREGRFLRVLRSLNGEDFVGLFRIHPVLGCVLMADHTHIYAVDWNTGETYLWRAESNEINWWYPHPTLAAIWVVYYDRAPERHIALWHHDQTISLKTDICSKMYFEWISLSNSVMGWLDNRFTYQFWDVEGTLTTSERECIPGDPAQLRVFDGNRCYVADLEPENDDDDQMIIEYELQPEPL